MQNFPLLYEYYSISSGQTSIVGYLFLEQIIFFLRISLVFYLCHPLFHDYYKKTDWNAFDDKQTRRTQCILTKQQFIIWWEIEIFAKLFFFVSSELRAVLMMKKSVELWWNAAAFFRLLRDFNFNFKAQSHG
jgi:hypothetical protein